MLGVQPGNDKSNLVTAVAYFQEIPTTIATFHHDRFDVGRHAVASQSIS